MRFMKNSSSAHAISRRWRMVIILLACLGSTRAQALDGVEAARKGRHAERGLPPAPGASRTRQGRPQGEAPSFLIRSMTGPSS